MSKIITSKRPNSANNVSHANNKNKKQQKLNTISTTINGIKFKTTAREARTLRRLTNK